MEQSRPEFRASLTSLSWILTRTCDVFAGLATFRTKTLNKRSFKTAENKKSKASKLMPSGADKWGRPTPNDRLGSPFSRNLWPLGPRAPDNRHMCGTLELGLVKSLHYTSHHDHPRSTYNCLLSAFFVGIFCRCLL